MGPLETFQSGMYTSHNQAVSTDINQEHAAQEYNNQVKLDELKYGADYEHVHTI